ncbi:MAG: hypothetical protein Q8M67_00240, partial [Bacteroidota bacterium]|nr:hypothetical protein [Bacteroidota bacterium]
LFILITGASQAQTRLIDLDTNRINQKSIRNFLKDQTRKEIIHFEDFQPSVTTQTDNSQFDSNSHHFSLQQTPAVAWNAYMTSHPANVWQGKVVSCGFIYSPVSKLAIFPDEHYPGLETGQIFFIEMRIIYGLVKFPVCFMVTKIDQNKQAITFSYVSSGSSKGAQTIRLIDNGKGGTEILHSSIHQTENALRDKTLYPIYHKKAIREVHRNKKKLLESN